MILLSGKDSITIHYGLLSVQLAALEERLAGRTEFEREKEEGFVKSRKLAKLVERYKIELNEARLEIRDLKARLLESSDIHVSRNEIFVHHVAPVWLPYCLIKHCNTEQTIIV